MEMTITRALAELKLLNKRIEDGTAALRVTAVLPKGKVPTGFQLVDDFTSKAGACIQSVKDLIERRARIKAAIVASNAVTEVELGGKKMTVAEAIERKTSIEYDRALLQALSKQLATANTKAEQLNVQIRNDANNAATAILGAEGKKSSEAEFKGIFDQFMERNEVKVAAPNNLEKTIDELKKAIEDFDMEADFVLSESNTRTSIEV